MGTNTPIQNTPYEAQGYEIKLTAERIEALLRALDTADAAEKLTGSTLEDLNAIIGAIKDWDKSDDDLGVKEQLINIYTKMLSEEEFNKAKEKLVSEDEFKRIMDTKMDGYIKLAPDAELDSLKDGWYYLPDGHNSFEVFLGHNYPHALYTTSLEQPGYAVQIVMCPKSIMWRSIDDDTYYGSWSQWKKIIDETDISSLKNIPIESGSGKGSVQTKGSTTAVGDYSFAEGFESVSGCNAFYIIQIFDSMYMLDSLEGLSEGDKCSVIFQNTERVDKVYQDFGIIDSIDTSTNSISFVLDGEKVPQNPDPSLYAGFLCVLSKPSIGTQNSGVYSHAEGHGTKSLGDRSHTEGHDCIAVGKNSHAEGNTTKAINVNAHSEGCYTEASGVASHTEGNYTIAKAGNTHAEGNRTIASGTNSHAEGENTYARGNSSHTEGIGTVSTREYSHVQGSYNLIDEEKKYLHIVGNGSSTIRSNAHTLDHYGNGWFAGDLECVVGGETVSMSSLLHRIQTLENFIANM